MSHGSTTTAALEAFERGYQAVPIKTNSKRPVISAWPHLRWKNEAEVIENFEKWAKRDALNIGLLLGEPSGGLIDIDLDNPLSLKLRDYFLPPTTMRTGRVGRPMSHHWFKIVDALPPTRQYRLPDGSVSVELRSTGAQTVIPPSTHPSGESYRWEGRKWGGAKGPAEVDGKKLSVQVALLGLGAVLVENWPEEGGRHEAYLALAGGLLRYGRDGVHSWWEKNLPVLIRALAQVTNDNDGPDARETETMRTTLERLRSGGSATGFPRLAEFIGNESAEQARRLAREVESLAGWNEDDSKSNDLAHELLESEVIVSTLPPEERDPLGERLGSWQPVDLEPYLAGEVVVPVPRVLRRSDGHGLFYEGRVNSLYGQSEAAKSWVALIACMQEMTVGERVMYLDFEDEPTFTLLRLHHLGVGDDDIRSLFTYVRPEDPHEAMQRNRWGSSEPTDIGRRNAELFQMALEAKDPSLIVVDGMTVLYGLHGLDSNDAVSTDIITTWLKRLCRNGRSTVIVIDHTGKGAGRGASPIGAHHKIAMVQGTALQVSPIDQPMPGVRGTVELIVYKDRPGVVRSVSTRNKPAVAAVVVLDSTEPNITRVEINPPDPDEIVVDGDEEAFVKAAERAEREREKAKAESRRKALAAELIKLMSTYDEPKPRAFILDEMETLIPEVDRSEVSGILDTELSEGRVVMYGKVRWARYALAELEVDE